MNVVGNEINFDAIWKLYNDSLYNLIANKTSNYQEAEDILQEVSLKLVAAIDNNSDIKNIKSWLFQVTKNTIADHYKGKNRGEIKESIFQQLHSSDNEIEGCVCDIVGFVIKNYLPEKYAEPLYMSDIEKVPQKKIAEQMGLSISGMKSRIQRARIMLKEMVLECVEITYYQNNEVSNFSLKPNCDLPENLIAEIEKNKISL